MSEFCFYYTLFQVILFFINRKNKTCCYTNEQVQKLSTMSNLYQELAAIYQAMYHTFMDYDSELEFYSKILKRYNIRQVLELGSGTGRLGQLFMENGFAYLGMDLSEEMVAIAQEKISKTSFSVGDMRNFAMSEPSESVVLAGRTVSYLVTNQDMMRAFASIHDNLKKDGILCFDFIDANQFILTIDPHLEIIHKASYKNIDYQRVSKWSLDLDGGMTFHWLSIFYRLEDDKAIEIGRDESIIRAFTKDEIQIFLELNGFEVLEFIEKSSYAFPTFVVIAVAKS